MWLWLAGCAMRRSLARSCRHRGKAAGAAPPGNPTVNCSAIACAWSRDTSPMIATTARPPVVRLVEGAQIGHGDLSTLAISPETGNA